jgi:hypothetical protein
VCVCVFFFSYLGKDVRREVSDNSRNQVDQLRSSWIKSLLHAPEKGRGLWLGNMTILFLYLVCATISHYYSYKHIDEDTATTNRYTHGVAGFHSMNPLTLGGFSFIQHDFILYLIVCGLLLKSVALFAKLTCWCTDPGIIDTRDQNFDEVHK